MLQFPGDNTIGSIWKWFASTLSLHHGPEEASAMGREVFSRLFALSPAERVMKSASRLPESDINRLQKIIEQLKQNVPLQYITGKTSFLDLELEVNPDVLIPRPETEELVLWIEETLGRNYKNPEPSFEILDIGTGSGCIALSLARRFPGASIKACDINQQVLEVVKRNAALNKVSVDTFIMDILKPGTGFSNLSLIVSNPPYVREQEKLMMQPNVLEYEPSHALFVTDHDPLVFYREISRKAAQWLKPGGYLFFEINEFLGKETADLVGSYGFTKVVIRKDLNGRDRMIRAIKH